MNNYKVIWFDDEHLELDMIKERALLNDIYLIGYSNAEEGLSELDKNLYHYDAVLIDGLFHKKQKDIGNSVNDSALIQVLVALSKLDDKKLIPRFILSGQPGFTKEKNSVLDGFKENEKVYDKLIIKDLDQLWCDIKLQCDNQLNTQIRHEHSKVFEIFDFGYLDRQFEIQLLDIIKSPIPNNNIEFGGLLSNIRGIIESYMTKLEEIKVIPTPKPQFSIILKHLSGNLAGPDYKPTSKIYQNSSIDNLHKWVQYTCSAYIHNLSDENYNDYMISNYAIESLRSGLLELLFWFKKTYEENRQ